MRFIKRAILAGIAVCFLYGPTAHAIDVEPPISGPAKTDSPVIVTGYAFQGPRLHYVQLFNSSDEVIDVTNWLLKFTITDQAEPVEIAVLHGLLKPKGYVVVADKQVIPTADMTYLLDISTELGSPVRTIALVPSLQYLEHVVDVKVNTQHNYWRRNLSSSTGNYLSTFTAFTPDENFILYGRGFYDIPESTTLQITEILANPRSCSPLDTAGDCMDYVKLYNPSATSVDLSQFRLRVGYLGQNPSSGNTFSLAGLLEPGHYAVITKSSDDRPVSLTNSGGFIWLEDTYGVELYESTVLEYPDAGADTKKGQAWAYDVSDGTWKWTIQPTPFNSPSVFPVVPPKLKATAERDLTPCKEGQYRSEETNRCRSIEAEATALAPCDDDEERNPATNRCRKLASLANQLTPCKEGQERNPETNRCRNIAASTPPDAAFAVEPVKDVGQSFVGWWALGGVGILALGYAGWEWRQEILAAIQKVGTFFTSGK
ncbi:MAG TPA: hypothetical protein VFT59_04610 [Candidatus Saccharimonadales bacterium]|nr:hypothetical protein [Candidatus Saccharimonadales bacterium]